MKFYKVKKFIKSSVGFNHSWSYRAWEPKATKTIFIHPVLLVNCSVYSSSNYKYRESYLCCPLSTYLQVVTPSRPNKDFSRPHSNHVFIGSLYDFRVWIISVMILLNVCMCISRYMIRVLYNFINNIYSKPLEVLHIIKTHIT